ncbi:hypothetical protein OEZ85_014150 [Tetradesmus obliquus]|uniref:Integrase catalytic domain-containing protein n=1 Tax=Tetradesmus obliquus TaxID=3088 RepID=A0ABY8UB19_TETOB|nr:hypothetical protein OEZ85_014150 [Tetradesmus obliquus]
MSMAAAARNSTQAPGDEPLRQLNKYNKALDDIKDSCFTAGQFDADLEPGNPDGTAADLFSGIHSTEAPGADLPSARHARYAATSQDVCFTFANNTKGYATAIGDCTVQIAHPTSGTRDIVLHDVYYVPEATANLLSIGKASKLPGMSFVFAGGNCNFFHNTDLIASTPEINNIYIFGHSAVPQAAAMLAKSAETPQLWHHRQAHLSYSSLAKQLHMVKGMHITTSQIQAASKAFCDVCPQAKGSKLPYHSHSSSAKATQPLARVHTDVMGPMEEISLGGKLWLATFIDEFTKYSIAVPMESKGDIKTVLPYTLAFMERQTNHKVKAVRSDNGPEYMSNTVLAYLKKNGIRHEPTVTYNPQQNGMAERFNRTLMEKARAMLIEASLPKNLWAEAVNTANELYLLAPAAGLTCTPYEAFFKQKPDISHLRVFGSKVYSVTPPSKRKKLDPKATLGTLVGYAPKGYRILSNDTGDIVISRDVYFDECLPAPTIPTLQQNPTAKPTKSVSWSPTLATAEPGNTPPAASTDSPSPAGASGSHQPAGASGSHQPAGAGGSHQPAGAIDRSSSTSPARTTSPWPALDPPASPPSSNTSPPPPLSASPSGRARKPSTRYPASDYAQHADDDAIVEPKTIGEALSGPQAREWRHAIHRELQSLQQHATWVLMQLPAGHKALDVKWVFKIKRHADGKIERYKARLVVKGFQQREGIDYTEVYAPVSQHSTFRILLALAAQYSFALHHIDITTAFLNGELEEEVYVRQPPGFVEGPAGYVLQLKKALYGLKQAPRAWHTKLKAALHDMHLQPTSADPGLYVRNDSGGILLALVWVDDIIYGGTAHVEETKTQLLSTFDGRDLGEASYFLGMTVTRDPAAATIHLQQEQYTKELIAKYGMSDSKPRSTPLPTGIKLAAGEGEPLDTSVYHYGSVVGALNYLATCTRPDIAFASSLLCRYLSCPTKQHWQAAMSVLAYLNGTTSMGLVFNGKLGGLQPRGFCDASYGDDPDTRRSTSGSVFTAASGAVIWCSRLQKCVTLSTCESEYVAASHAARDAIWFDKVMFETGFGTSRVQMYGDNQGALKLIRNPITSMRSKHIDVHYHFVRGNCNFFHNTDLIASTPEINNIYIFGHSAVPQAAAMLAKSAETPQLWHHRQAHLSYSSLAKQLHMVKGMHITTSQIQAASKAFCDVCPQAKGSKLPYHSHSSSAKATQPLARVHTDVMGPMEEISLGGKLWLATFIDEFTKYSIAVPMESKGDIKTVLPYTLAFMERQTNHKVKAVRSDNGPEYMSNTVLAYLKKNGIRHEPTVTYNPQQNGMAERFNRTLMEKARAMLIEASLPKNLWAEAVNTANELYLLAPAAGLTCTPYEAFFKQKPDISHLRVFGSKVYSVTPPSKRKKLDPKATLGTLVGYAPKGYRILSNDTGDIVISRDVYFDECLPAPTIPTLQQNPTAKPTKSVSWSPTLATAEPGNTPPAASTDSPSPAGASGSHQPAGASGSHQPAGAGGSHQPAGAIDRSSSTSPARTTSPWPALDPPASPPSSNTSPPPPLSASPSGRARKPSTRYPASDYAQHADDDAIVEPKTIGEALSGPQAREWRHAIHRELQSLQQHATWVLMQLPAGHKALDVKWVFKIKRHADGKIERYKARLVVKGFQQREGIDYTEVYAPVSQHSTFRILLALAAQYSFALHHIDITTAFLNGELEEEVYVRQPPGFVEGPAGYVLQLKKALYGLKQAPRAWHTKLKAALHDMHLQPTSADPGLYVRNDSGGILLALVWVDDIIYGGTAHVEETKTQLLSTFDGRDLGEASYFLGMTVTRDPAAATIHLQQEQYTKELIAKYGMSDSKPRSTPLPTGIKLAAGEGEPLDTSVYHYGSVVGALNYLATCTRPDIAFASSLLCRYLSCPTKQHWQAAMSVLAYLNGTTSMGLVFNGKLGGLQPRGFCDASYGDDPDTRRSTSGSVFTAASGAVIWCSRLQKCVTLSTCESEYVAASHAARDAIWFDKVMFETGFGTSRVQMYGDNQGALKLIRNPITSMRSKHIDVHYHFVREQAASGRIKISFISTDKMLADMLTKAVPEAKHVFCCAGIGLR